VAKEMRVVAASLHMEGDAARWYQVHKIQAGIESWDVFTHSMLENFGAEAYPKAMRGLLSLKQDSTLAEYNKQFEELRYMVAMHNSKMDETFFVTQYIKVLKTELQSPVQTMLPQSVNRAMLLADIQQETLDKSKFKSFKQPYQSKDKASSSKGDGKQQGTTPDLSKERQLREYRKLNGLCYACGEKFEPGHLAKCAKRQAMQLNAVTTDDMNMTLSDEVLEQLQKEDDALQGLCHLSLNAVSGADGNNCMKVRAIMNNKLMLLHIDSGSSHCFINSAMVNCCGLQQTACVPAKVTMANGDSLHSDTMVLGVPWWANGHSFSTNMRVLDLGPYDAILGYDWLSHHSPMECDWVNKTMSFMDRGHRVLLQGDNSQLAPVTEVCRLQVDKWLKGNEVWSFVLLQQVTNPDPALIQPAVAALIEEFQDIFSDPKNLPPSRPYDHHIPLVPRAIPVNARPYRYSAYHKTEIEKQVQSLLEVGLIVPSVSPFASPVLLVQKKDGS
jgi:hypothetical protein